MQNKISCEEFYANKTSLNPKRGTKRIETIKKQIAAWGLSLQEVNLEEHSDAKWRSRGNRSELEKKAAYIGGRLGWPSNTQQRWWLVPLKQPRNKLG